MTYRRGSTTWNPKRLMVGKLILTSGTRGRLFSWEGLCISERNHLNKFRSCSRLRNMRALRLSLQSTILFGAECLGQRECKWNASVSICGDPEKTPGVHMTVPM